MLFGYPLTLLSASTFSTLFTRQLVVPSLSKSAVMNTTGVVGILPVPTMQSDSVTEPPFTTGHGPVVASTASTEDRPWAIGHGPAMSSPTAALLWTTGHGSVVPEPASTMSLVQVVTTAAPTPASSLATVIQRSPAALNTSEVTRRPLITPSQINKILGCHREDNGWIYFTLMKPDSSIALFYKGKRVLYFVSKEWTLTYPNKVRKALFNDPSSYPTCPEGHCRSTFIPGTDLRLSLVKSPKVFRSGGYGDRCGYVDDVHTIRRNLVTRAKFGYLNNGVTVADHIIPFVESQVLTTYPELEIGLIVSFTVGVFVVFPLVMLFLVCLHYCVDYSMVIVCEKMKDCGQAVRQRIGKKRGHVDSRSQLPDPLPHQDRGYAAVPPAYSFV